MFKSKLILLRFALLLSLASASFISCSNDANTESIDRIPEFDISRFAGVWYEIARIPHRDEKDLQMVSITINLKDDKKEHEIIHKSWNTEMKDWQEKTGRIWTPDSLKLSCLRVSYVLFFGGDFDIMDIDRENYEWVLVKSGDLGTAWIFGRGENIPMQVTKDIAKTANDLGIPAKDFERVYQNLKLVKSKYK